MFAYGIYFHHTQNVLLVHLTSCLGTGSFAGVIFLYF